MDLDSQKYLNIILILSVYLNIIFIKILFKNFPNIRVILWILMKYTV